MDTTDPSPRPDRPRPRAPTPALSAQIPKSRRTWRQWAAAAVILALAAGGAAVVLHLSRRPPPPQAPVAGWSSPPAVEENLPTGGATHTCLVNRAGTALCWGTGEVGQLGVGTRRIALVPMAVTAAAPFSRISAGASHTCGVTSEGTVLCWGLNEEGQAGANSGAQCISAGLTYNCMSPPAPIAGLPRMRLVRAGGSFTCGLAEDGVAYCWGGNRRGQLGRTTGLASDPAGPVGSSPYPQFRDLAAGQFHACGVTTAGAILCWGWDLYGQLGSTARMARCTTGSTVDPCTDTPVPVSASATFRTVTAGAGHTCALSARGRAFCWGSNTHGQLGVGSTREKAPSPVEVTGKHEFSALAAGSYFTCGLTPSGEVWCWGDNASGQLGAAPDRLGQSADPVRVAVAGRALALGAGDRHACAILDGDRVTCWGNDGAAQLGDGLKAPTELPVMVLGDGKPRAGRR